MIKTMSPKYFPRRKLQYDQSRRSLAESDDTLLPKREVVNNQMDNSRWSMSMSYSTFISYPYQPFSMRFIYSQVQFSLLLNMLSYRYTQQVKYSMVSYQVWSMRVRYSQRFSYAQYSVSMEFYSQRVKYTLSYPACELDGRI